MNSHSDQPQPSIFTRNTILILFGAFSYQAASMLMNPLIVGFTHSLGASAVLAGMIAAMMNFVSLLFRPFAGQLTDTVSKYKLAFIGGGLLLLASVGYAVAIAPWMIALFRIANGIGFALCSVCMATWLSGMLPRNKVGMGMGYYGMMNALGMAIAPALGIFVYSHFSYRIAFLCATVFSAILLILIQFVLDRGLPLQTAVQGGKHKLRIVQPKVIPVAIIIMLLSIPYFATQSYIVEYVAARHLHVAVGSFFIIYAVILLVMRIVLKDYFDRVPFKWFLLAGTICDLIGMVGLMNLYNIWMMILAAAGLAGGYGLMYSVCQSTALLVAPMEEQGLANSTFYIGMDTGMVLGPIIGGFLYGYLPYSMFYPALMLVVPITAIVYLIFRKQLQV
ncbi:MFS transporter [Lacticaseibacillus sharpeae]|uniref:Multidrug transport protein n=1 Tax=Lacticaseibacillus sharpeae JCM 1186 = DSM 20505 TaxID=1291052 RepID=A0A0R1ZJN2_9LACO|nr:MFS transporter [Lacticaseibacillus sharpeae]KRM55168.1 multidrug transport protein [Lacticaseibacillus sharpeae JCM 1186 = DSM 20505]